MLENAIGKRYADALSKSIEDTGKLDGVLASLQSFCTAFETEPDLVKFFAHPGIPQESKKQMVQKICDKLKAGDAVRNMVLVLAERKKILFLRSISNYFEKAADERLNQVRVTVSATRELAKGQVNRLRDALGRILNKKIIIETRVDNSLIGGVSLQVGDTVADASLRNRLSTLKQAIEKEEVV